MSINQDAFDMTAINFRKRGWKPHTIQSCEMFIEAYETEKASKPVSLNEMLWAYAQAYGSCTQIEPGACHKAALEYALKRVGIAYVG